MQSPNNDYNATSKRGWFTRFLDTVEWLGNLLPEGVQYSVSAKFS